MKNISKFRRGARKVITTYFVEEAKSNYDWKRILLGILGGIISFVISIFFTVLLITQNINSELSLAGNILLGIIVCTFLSMGIGSIKNNLFLRKIRYYMKDIRKWQHEKGLSKGLNSFLCQNIQFNKHDFFHEWVLIFKEQEKKRGGKL